MLISKKQTEKQYQPDAGKWGRSKGRRGRVGGLNRLEWSRRVRADSD